MLMLFMDTYVFFLSSFILDNTFLISDKVEK